MRKNLRLNKLFIIIYKKLDKIKNKKIKKIKCLVIWTDSTTKNNKTIKMMNKIKVRLKLKLSDKKKIDCHNKKMKMNPWNKSFIMKNNIKNWSKVKLLN